MNDQTELLARLDERTGEILRRLDDFVTHDEFDPVKKLTYGMVTTILTFIALGVLGAIFIPRALANLIAFL